MKFCMWEEKSYTVRKSYPADIDIRIRHALDIASSSPIGAARDAADRKKGKLAMKLFKKQIFGSLNDFLHWVDSRGDQVAIVSILGASVLTVTYAELPATNSRTSGKQGIDTVGINSLDLVD